MMLMGQLWPEGVPPFAHAVNVIFLMASLLYFLFQLFKKTK